MAAAGLSLRDCSASRLWEGCSRTARGPSELRAL